MDFQPAQNIYEAWDAVHPFPLEPGDPRWVDCSRLRGDALSQIRRMLYRHTRSGRDLHLLFTGYRGNGKTTELYQLQNRIEQDYEVIYFDADKELDINNLAVTDMMLGIAKKTVGGLEKAGYPMSGKLLKDVGDWFMERVREQYKTLMADAGAKAEAGSPKWFGFICAKVFAGITVKTEHRDIIRQNFEKEISELISKVNALLSAARDEVRKSNKTDMIFIMDSLDRLRVGLDKALFIGYGAQLKQLTGNFIYVVPISLMYDQQAPLLPFKNRLQLPMIPIYEHGSKRKEHTEGIAKLKELIGRRAVAEKIFSIPGETMKTLILTSGGHLRDLMKLISYACNETDDIITPDHAKIAINTLIEDYKKVVREDDYEHVVNAYLTQDPPNDEITQKLIYNNVILVYRDPAGVNWKDVHPAVVENTKFQEALKKAQQ